MFYPLIISMDKQRLIPVDWGRTVYVSVHFVPTDTVINPHLLLQMIV